MTLPSSIIVRVIDPAQARIIRVSVPGLQGPAGSIDGAVQLLTTLDMDATLQQTLQAFAPTSDVLITGAIIRLMDASGVSAVPSMSIGTDAETRNVLVPTDMIGATETGQLWHYAIQGTSVLVPAATAVNVAIITAADATAYDIRVYMLGLILS